MYPTVAGHMKEGLAQDIFSLSHRDAFIPVFQETVATIRALLSVPEAYHIVFVSSGTEAMERIIENCVEQESLHLVNGAFSERFFCIAQELKKSPRRYAVPWGQGFDFSQIDIPRATELLCVTQNETSTGVALDMEPVYMLKKQYPDLFIALDIVSSAPYVAIDYHSIDCAFFSVHKGFGLPAGLGVIILSPRALEKAIYLQRKNTTIGSYHTFPALASFAEKNQTPETPNTLAIYLLGKVIADMQQAGITKLREEQEAKAQLLYEFFDMHPVLHPFVNKGDRSQTVIVVDTQGKTKEILQRLQQQGFIVGSGYGKYKDNQIRIAQFPAHSMEDVEKLLEAFAYGK